MSEHGATHEHVETHAGVGARPRLDVSHLPVTAFGSRDPMWWGVVGLIVMEAVTFAVVYASYLVYRGNESLWPPNGFTPLSRNLAALDVGLMVLSVGTTHLFCRGAVHGGKLRLIQLGLALSVVLALAVLGVRWAFFESLTFAWDFNAYASSVWVLVGMHTLHVLAGAGEDLMFLVLFLKGPIESKHLVDVKLNGLYWYFVVASWLATAAVLFLDMGVWRG